MNGFSDWFENNWIDLARLLVQCAILAVVVRYGRKLLATLRASQEQIGALLKLSVSGSEAERPAAVSEPEPEPARRYEPTYSAVPEPASGRRYEPVRTEVREPEPEPVLAGASSRNGGYDAEREHTLGGRVIGSHAPAFAAPSFTASPQRTESPSLTPWVSAPLAEPVRMNEPVAPVPPTPSVSTWLQTPVRRSSVSPLRRAIRWLQAPAGH
jgi:hypothetical protein